MRIPRRTTTSSRSRGLTANARLLPMTSKLDALSATLTGYGQVVVAFSGGVDSAFLLKVAVDALGDRCHAVTAVSPTMARSEIRAASELAAQLGLGARHHVVASHELERPGFTDNPTHRCALCKTELMDVAAPIAAELGAAVALGTNLDDLGDVRPGITAAVERGARMPLVDPQLTQPEVGELARIVEVRDAVVALGKQLGFAYVALDLAGFRSGSLNEVLPADALVKLRPGRAS